MSSILEHEENRLNETSERERSNVHANGSFLQTKVIPGKLVGWIHPREEKI